MKAIILGSSGGSITLSDPSSSILIENGGRYLLIDMGSGIMRRLIEEGVEDKVDDIIITHFHADHYADTGILIHDRLIKMQLGRSVNGLTFHTPYSPEQDKLFWDGVSTAETLNAGRTYEIAGLSVRTYRAVHPVECFSLTVSDGVHSIFYTSDTAMSDSLIENAKEADVTVAECSLYKEYEGLKCGHMNALDAASLAKEIGNKRLLLTHLPIYGDRNELLGPARDAGLKNVELAHPGLKIEL